MSTDNKIKEFLSTTLGQLKGLYNAYLLHGLTPSLKVKSQVYPAFGTNRLVIHYLGGPKKEFYLVLLILLHC